MSSKAKPSIELSICSDYTQTIGSPKPLLEKISRAGFTHILWGHQWNTDFLYSKYEIAQIKKWLQEFNLQLLDIHGSEGVDKYWFSPNELTQQAGIELIANRLEMAKTLAGRTVVMHLPVEKKGKQANTEYWRILHKALDLLIPHIKRTGIRIALENSGLRPDNFPAIKRIFTEYDSKYIGLCYDSGHGVLHEDGLDNLETVKNRLIALHLNDNDYSSDNHGYLFSGVVDWDRQAKIIASSSYQMPLNLEVTMTLYKDEDELTFLKKAYADGVKLTKMVEAYRKSPPKS